MSEVSDMQCGPHYTVAEMVDQTMMSFREGSRERIVVDCENRITHREAAMMVLELVDRLAQEQAIRQKTADVFGQYAEEVGKTAEGGLL